MNVEEAIDYFNDHATDYAVAFIDDNSMVREYDEEDEFVGVFTQDEYIERIEEWKAYRGRIKP
jgi:hypothetical protein